MKRLLVLFLLLGGSAFAQPKPVPMTPTASNAVNPTAINSLLASPVTVPATFSAASQGSIIITLKDAVNNAAGSTFSFPSNSELTLISNSTLNAMAFQNTNATGFSASAFRGSDNYEHTAVGFGNPTAPGAIWHNLSYVEFSTFDYVNQGFKSPTTLTTNADTPSGTVLPFSSTTGVSVNDVVTGTNIVTSPVATYVVSIVANTSVTLNQIISGDVASGASITFHPSAYGSLVQTGYLFGANDNYKRISLPPSGDIFFHLANKNVGMDFNSNTGFMGIGTSQAPVARLDVAGAGAIVAGDGGNGSRASAQALGYAVAGYSASNSGKVFAGIKDTVVKFETQINGTSTTRRVDTIDPDNTGTYGSGATPFTRMLNGTGQSSAQAGVQEIIAVLKSANMNITTDQTFAMIPNMPAAYELTKIEATNCGSSPAGSAGGIYTATSKGGSAIVAAGQTYTSLATAAAIQALTIASAFQSPGTSGRRTDQQLYFSLTSALGSADTCDLYVFGTGLP